MLGSNLSAGWVSNKGRSGEAVYSFHSVSFFPFGEIKAINSLWSKIIFRA